MVVVAGGDGRACRVAVGEVGRRVGEGVRLRAERLGWASAERRRVFVIVARVGFGTVGDDLSQGCAARRGWNVLRRAREYLVVLAVALFVLFLAAGTGGRGLGG